MSGKIVVDALQRPNGDTLTLPMNVGQGGKVMVDDQGQMAVQPEQAAPRTEIVKVYDFEATPAALLDVLWDDLDAGLTLNDVAFVKMRGSGLSGTAEMQLYFKALSAAGVTIDTGYMSFNYMVCHGGGQFADGQSHNSNAGTMWFPTYTTAARTGYGHGSGNMNFDALLRPHADGDNRGVSLSVNGSFMQATTYNYATLEQSSWKNFDANAGIAGFPAGFRVYPSSGQLDRGFLEVAAVLKPGA